MAISDIDFEGAANQQDNNGAAVNSTNGNNNAVDNEDKTNLNGGDTDDITSKDGSNAQEQNTNQEQNDDDNPSTGDLNVGDQLDIDGQTYVVAENGDLVDEQGKIFKEAKDVKEWLKTVSVEDNEPDDSELSINAIQNAVGVTVTDENGNAIEFTNDAAGVRSYIDSVMNIRSNELQQAAINRLYSENPLLRQFQDYVQLTGTPRGFGEIPDRSGIVLDKDNTNQLIAVVKMAANEFGNKSLNDNYIKYLTDTGGLYDEARNQLKALVDKDKAYRAEIEKRAAEQRDAEAKSINEYWNNVSNIINNRVIGGYRIPESFTKEVNGQKMIYTPKDFLDYVSVARETEDGQRMTAYQRDLANMSDEDYLNREMLDAWLMFTGGTYKDLIDMAVKEDKVRQLRIKSRENRSAKSVKVIRNKASKTSIDDILL